MITIPSNYYNTVLFATFSGNFSFYSDPNIKRYIMLSAIYNSLTARSNPLSYNVILLNQMVLLEY